MGPSTPNEKGYPVDRLLGINERLKFSNPNLAEWDSLTGMIQQRAGIPQRLNGSRLLSFLPGRKIISIKQTFDERQNVIVQTDLGVYIYTEDELMGRSVVTNLTPVISIEEEDMSLAILVHYTAAGVNSGSYSVANVWQQAPLTTLDQRNPDGSAAAFVTAFAANRFTLATGTYRFRGWSAMSNATAGRAVAARLFDVTAGLAAAFFTGNAISPAKETGANGSIILEIGGSLTIAAPTQFEIQGLGTHTQANTGFGFPKSGAAPAFTVAGEMYRYLEVLKTA